MVEVVQAKVPFVAFCAIAHPPVKASRRMDWIGDAKVCRLSTTMAWGHTKIYIPH